MRLLCLCVCAALVSLSAVQQRIRASTASPRAGCWGPALSQTGIHSREPGFQLVTKAQTAAKGNPVLDKERAPSLSRVFPKEAANVRVTRHTLAHTMLQTCKKCLVLVLQTKSTLFTKQTAGSPLRTHFYKGRVFKRLMQPPTHSHVCALCGMVPLSQHCHRISLFSLCGTVRHICQSYGAGFPSLKLRENNNAPLPCAKRVRDTLAEARATPKQLEYG